MPFESRFEEGVNDGTLQINRKMRITDKSML